MKEITELWGFGYDFGFKCLWNLHFRVDVGQDLVELGQMSFKKLRSLVIFESVLDLFQFNFFFSIIQFWSLDCQDFILAQSTGPGPVITSLKALCQTRFCFVWSHIYNLLASPPFSTYWKWKNWKNNPKPLMLAVNSKLWSEPKNCSFYTYSRKALTFFIIIYLYH